MIHIMLVVGVSESFARQSSQIVKKCIQHLGLEKLTKVVLLKEHCLVSAFEFIPYAIVSATKSLYIRDGNHVEQISYMTLCTLLAEDLGCDVEFREVEFITGLGKSKSEKSSKTKA